MQPILCKDSAMNIKSKTKTEVFQHVVNSHCKGNAHDVHFIFPQKLNSANHHSTPAQNTQKPQNIFHNTL